MRADLRVDPEAASSLERRGDGGGAVVSEVLAEYGERVRAELVGYLRPREPLRHLYGPVADYPRRGGRMLRPSLCVATARAFGASAEDAIGTAIALELMHNSFLVHDDVEDDSEERRGKPTLHVLHGVPVAVNVGDALAVLSIRALIDNQKRLGPRLALRLLEEAERMARETVEGQAIELGWRRDNALDLEDEAYLEMVLKKTCWYTAIFPCRSGALIGTRDGADLDAFVRFGFFLGAAFQIQDDVLNLVGDPRRYGKEIDGDLQEGKRTLMLIHLLRQASHGERARLREILVGTRDQRREEDVVWMRERMDAHGSIDYAREMANGLAGAALHEFDRVFGHLPPSRDRTFVEALPRWVITRA